MNDQERTARLESRIEELEERVLDLTFQRNRAREVRDMLEEMLSDRAGTCPFDWTTEDEA